MTMDKKDSKKKRKPLENKQVTDKSNKENIGRYFNCRTVLQPEENLEIDYDITSNRYWNVLAETDRIALDAALNENRNLHHRINELEIENVRLKALLDEARSLVDVLTDLLEEDGEESIDDRSDYSIEEDQ